VRNWCERKRKRRRERERERERMCVRVSARVCVCVCVYVLEQRVVSSTLLDLIHHSHAAQVWVGESV